MLSPCGDFALGFLESLANVSITALVLSPFESASNPVISPVVS